MARKWAHHDLASEGEDLTEVSQNVFVFALELGPTPIESTFYPRSELDTELFVEGTEEAENLDDLERRLPIEVHCVELFHDLVHKWLHPTGILVVEDVLQKIVRDDDPSVR